MYYFTSHRNPLSKITNANLAKIVKGLGSDGLANYASLLKTQQMGQLTVGFNTDPVEPTYTMVNGARKLGNQDDYMMSHGGYLHCRFGTVCQMYLEGYTVNDAAVDFGGLKLSITVDSARTVNATDHRTGNYSVIIPSTWLTRIGKHTITINSAGVPIKFDETGGGPVMNPLPLTILPVDCSQDLNSSPSSNGHSCVCKPGTSIQSNGRCQPCEAGTYARSFGVLTCFSSDFAKSQLSLLPAAQQCIPCPPCMLCSNGVPSVKAGWSPSGPSAISTALERPTGNASASRDIGIYRCPDAKACKAGSSAEVTQCSNSTAGKFCASCARGFFRSRATRTCLSCEDSALAESSANVWIAVGSAVVVLVLALRSGAAQLVDQAGIKIVLGYLQVMSQLGSVLDLDYASMLPSFAAAIKAAGSLFFGVSDIFRRVHCSLDFYQLFFADVVGIPLCLLVVIWLKYKLLDVRRLGIGQAQHVRRISAFFVAFMLYPSLSNKIFRVFVCRKFGPDEAGWLEADYSISCGSDKYRLLHAAALVLVLMVPVGLPLLFAVLLRRRRASLLEFESLTVGVLSPTDRSVVREQAELTADKAHRDWPWKDRHAAAVQPWIASAQPSPIGHIAERAVSTAFLRSFTESKCRRNQTTRSVHMDIVLQETLATHSRYVSLIHQLSDEDGRPVVGRATFFVSHCWNSPWDSLVDALLVHAEEQRQLGFPDGEPYYWIDIFAV